MNLVKASRKSEQKPIESEIFEKKLSENQLMKNNIVNEIVNFCMTLSPVLSQGRKNPMELIHNT
jgi:hypothetical protein